MPKSQIIFLGSFIGKKQPQIEHLIKKWRAG